MDFVFQRSYRGPLKAAILDWAGTTVDYGCFAPANVFIEGFKKQGIEITIEQARGPMGMHKKDHIRAITQMQDVKKQWQTAHGRQPGEDDVEAIFRDFVPLQIQTLSHHAELIPGTLETVNEMRSRGMKIGTTTGYIQEMMDVVIPQAAKQGYKPDANCNGSHVQQGRPAPWMCFLNAIELNLYPMEAYVKAGDTVQDILEGLNAGMWTVGLAVSGNEMGMHADEIQTADPHLVAQKKKAAYDKLQQAGAHYVIDQIGDLPPVLDHIQER
ncbi:phosphonoacetaldehyde hydrolase, partial [bacterium]|nr:phosphonoacetaldehyde hydrolase [bacterium]